MRLCTYYCECSIGIPNNRLSERLKGGSSFGLLTIYRCILLSLVALRKVETVLVFIAKVAYEKMVLYGNSLFALA